MLFIWKTLTFEVLKKQISTVPSLHAFDSSCPCIGLLGPAFSWTFGLKFTPKRQSQLIIQTSDTTELKLLIMGWFNSFMYRGKFRSRSPLDFSNRAQRIQPADQSQVSVY